MADLSWQEVADAFDGARNWWVATSGPDGPHSVPVWGVAVDGVLTFYGQESAVRSRNLASDPRVVLHLEDGETPIIVHGTAAPTGLLEDRADLESRYSAKYTWPTDAEYLPGAEGMEGTLVYEVSPTKAMTWTVTASDQWENRRWTP
jgi:hypothetical protein